VYLQRMQASVTTWVMVMMGIGRTPDFRVSLNPRRAQAPCLGTR
jgi:hypothetical protein